MEKVPRPVDVILPPLAVVKKRLVELAVVEKKLVVVAEVPVALMKVKFWRVVEPVTRKSASIVELAVERKPFKKPRVVEVATP